MEMDNCFVLCGFYCCNSYGSSSDVYCGALIFAVGVDNLQCLLSVIDEDGGKFWHRSRIRECRERAAKSKLKEKQYTKTSI